MSVVIYHNPRCSKSRATLALLRQKGIEPTVIEYLNTPPDAGELKRILKLLAMSPRQLLRKKEADEAGLDDDSLDDDRLIETMIADPRLIERPIVLANGKAALGRPPERVLDII